MGSSIPVSGTAKAPPSRSWARYRRNQGAVAGLVVVAALAAVAVTAPILTVHPPLATAVALPLQSPSGTHWMGTDDLGRDVFSGFLYGARTSLMIGPAAGLTAVLLGCL